MILIELFTGAVDWKTLLGLLVGSLSTGGLIGYWIKSIIDSRKAEREWKRKYYYEDLRKQRELLLEFLGKPYSEFITLLAAGHTWDETWRRNKAKIVAEWVEQYRPLFPECIRKTLTRIGYIAGSMVVQQSQELVQRNEGYKAAQQYYEVIRTYLEEIEKKLKGS